MSFAKLQEKYGGMYVLTDKPEGKIVAASRDLKKALKEADKKGISLPAVRYVEPKGTIHIYERNNSFCLPIYYRSFF